MKNPMDRQLEKRFSDRAVAIGREGETAAFGELLELLNSSSANARRLAASALGKLAWMGVDQAAAVAALAPVARDDPHAQTRQYATKALKASGAASRACLSDLRDVAANPSEPPYNRRDAASAVQFIEEALRIVAEQTEHRCQRCHQQEGKRLVSVYPADLPHLRTLLTTKLRLFGYTIGIDERSEATLHAAAPRIDERSEVSEPRVTTRPSLLAAGG